MPSFSVQSTEKTRLTSTPLKLHINCMCTCVNNFVDQEMCFPVECTQLHWHTVDLGHDLFPPTTRLLVHSLFKHYSLHLTFFIQRKGSERYKADHEWVQCYSCRKWRILNAGFDTMSLPDEWFVSTNHSLLTFGFAFSIVRVFFVAYQCYISYMLKFIS